MTFALFPSFFDHPSQISFGDQEENEEIILFLRQHWFTNVGWVITTIFLIFVPTLAVIVAPSIPWQGLKLLPINVLQAMLVLWYMLVVAYVLEKFLHWYFNIYIVTNLHLVDINFNSLLSRTMTQVQIEDVEGVTSKVAGIFGSVFNYGNVDIETAAENQRLNFAKVPFPDLVADRVQDLQPRETANA